MKTREQSGGYSVTLLLWFDLNGMWYCIADCLWATMMSCLLELLQVQKYRTYLTALETVSCIFTVINNDAIPYFDAKNMSYENVSVLIFSNITYLFTSMSTAVFCRSLNVLVFLVICKQHCTYVSVAMQVQ